MAASYPAAIKTFSAIVNGVTKLVAALFNSPYDEVTAIETELGTDPAGSLSDLKTRLAVSIADDGTLKTKIKWVKFQGSNGTILADEGVNTVVRNATGDYTITWDVAFSNANYAVVANCEDDASTRNTDSSIKQASQAAGSIVIYTHRTSTAGAVDFTSVHVIAIGT